MYCAHATCDPTCYGNVQQRLTRATLELIPPEAYFVLSAIFHYMSPALRCRCWHTLRRLAWLRIARAAFIFAIRKHPWRAFRQLDAADQLNVLMLGLTLAAMNAVLSLLPTCNHRRCTRTYLRR
jgi:threonine/homoserine efflux transporter RhtA